MALVTKSFSDIITFTRASTATYFNSAGVLTSAAINAPRFDYDPATLAARGLLIEEQRTNNAVWSESFRSVTLTVTSVSGTFANGETVTATGGGTGTYISATSTPTAFAIFNGTGTFTGTLTGSTSGATATISSVVGVYTPLFATVSADATTSPANTVTADKLQEDATTNAHYIQQAFTPVNATTYTLSVFLKAAERGFAFVGFVSGSMATTFISVNLSTGAISTATGTPVASTTQAIGNGWYRVSISLTSTGTTQSFIDIRISTDGVWANRSYAGVAGNGIFLWGAQLEAGAFPTSYIPTTTTALTRSADVASVNTLSPWFNATEGTLYAEFTRGYTGNFSNFVSPAVITNNLSGASANSIASAVTNGVNQQLYNSMVVNNVEQLTYQQEAAQTTNKTALAYKTNDTQQFTNGAAETADTSCTVPTSVSQMNIGAGAVTTAFINSWIRRVTYYPRRLSQAEGIAITTP